MKILYKKGFAVDTKAECIVNSANGLLMHDSSGAGRIREVSKKVSLNEFQQYFSQLDSQVQTFILDKAKEHQWKPRFANLTATKLVLENKKKFRLGQAVVDKELSLNLQKIVIHAITVNYDPLKRKRIVGNEKTIERSYTKAITIGISLGAKTVALPLPIARKGYGLNPQKSYSIVMKVLQKFTQEDVTFILCFDNTDTKKYLENLKN